MAAQAELNAGEVAKMAVRVGTLEQTFSPLLPPGVNLGKVGGGPQRGFSSASLTQPSSPSKTRPASSGAMRTSSSTSAIASAFADRNWPPPMTPAPSRMTSRPGTAIGADRHGAPSRLTSRPGTAIGADRHGMQLGFTPPPGSSQALSRATSAGVRHQEISMLTASDASPTAGRFTPGRTSRPSTVKARDQVRLLPSSDASERKKDGTLGSGFAQAALTPSSHPFSDPEGVTTQPSGSPEQIKLQSAYRFAAEPVDSARQIMTTCGTRPPQGRGPLASNTPSATHRNAVVLPPSARSQPLISPDSPRSQWTAYTYVQQGAAARAT